MNATTETIRLPFASASGDEAPKGGTPPEWEEHLDLIRRTVAQGATSDELRLFLYTARRTGLDPLARQIYFIRRGGKGTIQASIDGLRLIADRTGRYAGGDAPEFLGETPEGFPLIARVTVHKLVGGVRCPFSATARWDEYYPGETGGAMWRRMAHTMLAKCAEALALRRAFPADLSGLYVHEEMSQAGPGVRTVGDGETAPVPDPVPEEPRRHGPGVTPETPLPREPATDPAPYEPGPGPAIPEPAPGPAPVGDPPPIGPQMSDAFGYRPARWPSARTLSEAGTEAQFRMMRRKADERKLDAGEIGRVRESLVSAYGLADDSTKGALSLVIDFLMSASPDQLDAARAAAGVLRRAA